MLTIAIINYECGNLESVAKAFASFGLKPIITQDVTDIQSADMIVLPGQGAMGKGMYHLNRLGLISVIKDHIARNKPFLGICLGMQLLFDFSQEDGGQEGLGIFEGQVKKFNTEHVKVPQMGWNRLRIVRDPDGYFDTMEGSPYMYFANSYYVEPKTPECICTVSEHGISFPSSIQRGALLALQCHPEKSGQTGLHVLHQFIKKFS